MMWIGIAFLSRILFSACNVLDSHFRQAVFKDAYTQNFCCTLYYLPILLVLFFVLHPQMPLPGDWPWLIISGIMLNTYLLPYYEAMKWGDSSSIGGLFTLSRIFTPLLAFVLIGERLTLQQYIGFGVVLAGAFYLTYDRAVMKFSFKTISLMAFSGFMLAVSVVTSKRVFGHMPWLDAYSYMLLISTLTGLVPYLLPKLRPGICEGVKQLSSHEWTMGLNMACALGGNIFFNLALSLTLASYLSMIGMFQPFFVMALSYGAYKMGWLQAKESFHPHDMLQKIIAFLIMTGGVVFTLWKKT